MEQPNLPALLLACLTVELTEQTRTPYAQLPAPLWVQLQELAVEQRVSSLLWQRLNQHQLTPLIPAAPAKSKGQPLL